MKIDFNNFLSKPIEDKVRNPFFLALIVSILSYNKKFVFTVFLPADGWDERWTLLGEYWMAADVWDYLTVAGLAVVYTIGFYAVAYITYIIAMFYDKRLRPWIGKQIYKKGFVERSVYENLKSAHETVNTKLDESTEEARELKGTIDTYLNDITTLKKGMDIVFGEINRSVVALESDLDKDYSSNQNSEVKVRLSKRKSMISTVDLQGFYRPHLKNLKTRIKALEDNRGNDFSTYRRFKESDFK